VVCGSDSGHVWCWDRRRERVAALVKTDETVANGCIPHPFWPTLACYGIESNVKVLEVGAGDAEASRARDHRSTAAGMGAPPDTVGSVIEAHLVGSVLETNLRRVQRGNRGGRSELVRDVDNFLENIRVLRRPREGDLPDFPSDLVPGSGQLHALLGTVQEADDRLRRLKDDGNALFKAGRLCRAARVYEKVLLYAVRGRGGGRDVGSARSNQSVGRGPGRTQPRRWSASEGGHPRGGNGA
jgi:hypothetical protein